MNTLQEQQGFYQRGSPRSNSLLYSTFPHEYYKNALHISNISTYHLVTISMAQARGTIFVDSLYHLV